MIKKTRILLLLSLLISCSVWASRGSSVPGSRMVTARGAALGDALMPLVQDSAGALFYNPAHLASLKSFGFEPFNLTLSGNHRFLSNVKSTSMLDMMDLEKAGPTLKENPLQHHGFHGSLFPNISFRGFAGGLLVQSREGARWENSQYRVKTEHLVVPTVGIGTSVASGILKFGYSLQYVSKSAGTTYQSETASDLSYNRGLKEGAGISHNAGVAFTLPFYFLPSFQAVARNVGGVKYDKPAIIKFARAEDGEPEDEKMSIDASFSFQPILRKSSKLNLSVVYRDLTGTSGLPFMTRLAAGMEVSIRNRFFLRGGYGDGYPSAGFGIETSRGEFSVSWFSEELGTKFHEERDIRFMLQYRVQVF